MTFFVFLAKAEQPPIDRLDPVTRAKVLMALLGLVLLGFLLVGCVMIGGRWTRRRLRGGPPRREFSSRPESGSTGPAPSGIADLGETYAGGSAEDTVAD